MTEADHVHKSHGVNSPLDWARITMSVGLVAFSVTIVMALIVQGDTKIAQEIHPAAAGCIMWGCITWMTMVEGGQASLVGLPPVDRELYRESHPITYQITGRGLSGNNLDRYLTGRQFLVIFLNFTISQAGSPLPGSTVFGFPALVTKIFLESGIAMVLQNVCIGQLTSQVNASHCMLDYINNHFMTFTLYASFVIEFSGVMHTSYLIHWLCCYLAGKPVVSNEPPMGTAQAAFFYGRCLFSMMVLCYSLAVTIDALFQGQTTMAAWGLPTGLSLVLFFVLMGLVGLLEGMQIAFFTVAKLPATERGTSKIALANCNCLFKNGGRNLPGFMVGRQMTVTMCFFVIARVTTVNVKIGTTPNIFGVSDGMQGLFNTGLLGAIVTTILGSISWQFVALSFPIGFLSNPLVWIVLRFALILEGSGICSSPWFFALIQKKVMGFQFDEVYIGTPEERAAKGHADDPDAMDNMHLGTNVLQADAGAFGINSKYDSLAHWQNATYSERRTATLKNITELREQIKVAESDEERSAFESALKLEVASLGKINRDQEASASNLADSKMAEENV